MLASFCWKGTLILLFSFEVYLLFELSAATVLRSAWYVDDLVFLYRSSGSSWWPGRYLAQVWMDLILLRIQGCRSPCSHFLKVHSAVMFFPSLALEALSLRVRHRPSSSSFSFSSSSSFFQWSLFPTFPWIPAHIIGKGRYDPLPWSSEAQESQW